MKGKGSMHHEKEVTSQVLRGKPQPKRYFNASACTIDRRKMLLCWYSSKHVEHAFRKIKARVSPALQLALNISATTRLRLSNSMGLPMVWVVVKYKKWGSWPRSDVRRSISHFPRDLAVGTLLNVVLLAYVSDENFILHIQIFQGQANRSSQRKIERAKKNSRSLRPTPCHSLNSSLLKGPS